MQASVYFVTHENNFEIRVIDTIFTTCPEYVSTGDLSRIAFGWKLLLNYELCSVVTVALGGGVPPHYESCLCHVAPHLFDVVV